MNKRSPKPQRQMPESRVHQTPFKGPRGRPYSPMTTELPAPAGATYSVRLRAAHLGRPVCSCLCAYARTHPPIERPAVRPGPDSPAAYRPSDGVERCRRGHPSRATADADCLERSCDSLVRFPPRCLTPSFASAGRTRGRPTGTAGWGRPSSNLGGTVGPKLGTFRPSGGTQTRVTARVIP